MKKILIVEDETVIATVYKNKFTRAGFDVAVALDGDEGLGKLATWHPDLVLLDVMLPKIDGLELLRTIRADPVTRSLPVIVYSNAFTATITAEAKRLGASTLLSKSDTRPNQVVEIASALLLQNKMTEYHPYALNDREQFYQNARQTVAEMRQILRDCLQRNDSSVLADLRHKTRVLGAMSWLSELLRVARLSEALEALLRTLCEHPEYVTFSTDKTILQTVECLEELMNYIDEAQAPIETSSVLIVDDEEVSLFFAQTALKSAKLSSTPIADPEEAMVLLQENSYDLILLDIDMPKMDGMSLCTYLRSLPNHHSTPVVFFSQLSEISYRIDSTAAGGNDFIGKPFLGIELAVKALTWIVRPRAHAF